MTYSNKYHYHKLSRENIDGSRHYATPTGERVPSVTTILEATKPEEKKRALNEWRKRVGTVRAQQITTEAASRGTKMHSYLEWFIKEGTFREPPGNPFHRASWSMAKQVIDQGLLKCSEFWGVEVPLYFPKVYAGTTDCVGVHNQQECIIDFKQTNKPKKREWIDDYFLQLCAYSEAHNEVYGTNIKRGVVMMCVKPETDANGNIITEPQYQEFILEGDEYEKYRSEWWNRVEQYYSRQI